MRRMRNAWDVVVTIGNETFRADSPLVPLLRELNKVGLRSTQHCIGDVNREYSAFLYLDMEGIESVSVVTDRGAGPRLVIRWRMVNQRRNGNG